MKLKLIIFLLFFIQELVSGKARAIEHERFLELCEESLSQLEGIWNSDLWGVYEPIKADQNADEVLIFSKKYGIPYHVEFGDTYIERNNVELSRKELKFKSGVSVVLIETDISAHFAHDSLLASLETKEASGVFKLLHDQDLKQSFFNSNPLSNFDIARLRGEITPNIDCKNQERLEIVKSILVLTQKNISFKPERISFFLSKDRQASVDLTFHSERKKYIWHVYSAGEQFLQEYYFIVPEALVAENSLKIIQEVNSFLYLGIPKSTR